MKKKIEIKRGFYLFEVGLFSRIEYYSGKGNKTECLKLDSCFEESEFKTLDYDKIDDFKVYASAKIKIKQGFYLGE